MDLEDELPSPDASPVVIGHGVALLPEQVEKNVDLSQVLAEFGTLPAIVTSIHGPQEERVVPPAECRTPDAHVDLLVAPAGPTVVPDDDMQPPTGSVGCSPIPLTTPAVPTPEKNLFFLGQPWVDPSSGGDPVDYRLLAAPLTSRPATVSHHVGEWDAVRECVNVPNLSREGPFDIHRGHHHSGASPRLRQDNQGCPFRMTSYDPQKVDQIVAYGVQLHDPRLLEYVGAPESARLLSRSPEYWVQHMGREKTLSGQYLQKPSKPAFLVQWQKSTDHHPDAETPAETDACILPIALENCSDPTMISPNIPAPLAETPGLFTCRATLSASPSR